MKNIYLLPLLILLFSCSETKIKPKKSIERIDTTSYNYKGFNNELNLDLYSNNTFQFVEYWYGCTGGGEYKKFYGSYLINGNQLLLKPDSAHIESLPYPRRNNPIIKKVTQIDDSLKFKTKYHLMEWNNTSYALSEQSFNNNLFFEVENDLENFINYYNNGYEPKNHGRYLTRTLDTLKTAIDFDKNLLPEKYRNHIFNQPLQAKIISIKKIINPNYESYYLIELDKGKSSNVNYFLKFIDKNKKHIVTIDSLTENSSFGKARGKNSLKEGMILQTIRE
ncbi:hypothetical protein [Aureivirga sp. CE67]|uniref:hypothetical protein n=1 Tax=Aureivirga sp. CE67 TaxID=1788983 RepID=UPI0018CA1B51|nr:hypothetical protein [Aureivirga sp. CE67]